MEMGTPQKREKLPGRCEKEIVLRIPGGSLNDANGKKNWERKMSVHKIRPSKLHPCSKPYSQQTVVNQLGDVGERKYLGVLCQICARIDGRNKYLRLLQVQFFARQKEGSYCCRGKFVIAERSLKIGRMHVVY